MMPCDDCKESNFFSSIVRKDVRKGGKNFTHVSKQPLLCMRFRNYFMASLQCRYTIDTFVSFLTCIYHSYFERCRCCRDEAPRYLCLNAGRQIPRDCRALKVPETSSLIHEYLHQIILTLQLD